MQIELAAEIEAKLEAEATRRGLTTAQLSSEVLSEHVAKSAARSFVRTPEQERFLDDYIARMKANSPGWETRDPYAVDWQAIKAEGRKY